MQHLNELASRLMDHLRRDITNSPGNVALQRFVVQHGRPFVGIARPKGYRQRKKGACFSNAAILAMEERGTYVEGYVLPPGRGWPVHHAWVSLNGRDAIDVTLQNAPECEYFGIPFKNSAIMKAVQKQGTRTDAVLNYWEAKGWPTLLQHIQNDFASAIG